MRVHTALSVLPVAPRVAVPVPDGLVRGEWKEHGACRQIDPDLWFADSSRRIHARAASICDRCPVRRPCLAWALVFDERFGVWGGLSPAGRRALRRRLTAGEPLDTVLDEELRSSGSAPVPNSAAWGEVA
jgi:hypothetical protein